MQSLAHVWPLLAESVQFHHILQPHGLSLRATVNLPPYTDLQEVCNGNSGAEEKALQALNVLCRGQAWSFLLKRSHYLGTGSGKLADSVWHVRQL